MKIKFLLMGICFISFSAYASFIGEFTGQCKYIDSNKLVQYEGACVYKHEIFKESDELAVWVYTTKLKNEEVRVVVYPNNAASLNDTPAISKSSKKQLTVTSGTGEEFVLKWM